MPSSKPDSNPAAYRNAEVNTSMNTARNATAVHSHVVRPRPATVVRNRRACPSRRHANTPNPTRKHAAANPKMNVVSLRVKLVASSAPVAMAWRCVGLVRNASATMSSIASETSPVRESSRPVRVTVSTVGLMANSSAATGAPIRPRVR